MIIKICNKLTWGIVSLQQQCKHFEKVAKQSRESRRTVTPPTLYCQLIFSTSHDLKFGITAFVSCPGGCRIFTSRVNYYWISSIESEKPSIEFENSNFKSENPTSLMMRCYRSLLLFTACYRQGQFIYSAQIAHMSLLFAFSHALVTVSQRPRILGTRPHVPQGSYVSIE